MIKALGNAFKIPDLRKKIFITLLLIAIYRLGCFIPTPGINGQALSQYFEKVSHPVFTKRKYLPCFTVQGTVNF